MEPVFTLRVSSLTQKQRHRDTAQQDREYCSAAAHSWSGWRASGRNLAVRVPSHCTAPAGDMSPMGPLLSVVTCVTTRPAPLHTADTNINSELRPVVCSTIQHSAAQHRSARVHGTQLTAPHRAGHCTHPHHCTVPHCTALYMCGEEMCFVSVPA